MTLLKGIVSSRTTTWSGTKRISSGVASLAVQRNSTSRRLIWLAASSAAIPLRSVPDDAAVAEVFGTFSVVVLVTLMRSSPTLKASATICAILVCRPWPISQPPWFSWIEPSV